MEGVSNRPIFPSAIYGPADRVVEIIGLSSGPESACQESRRYGRCQKKKRWCLLRKRRRQAAPTASGTERRPPCGNRFSNALGRPKTGPEKALGRARRGPKYASLGGSSAQSGRLHARGWRPGNSLNVHGLQDWTRASGLTLMLAMACRHSAQRHAANPAHTADRAALPRARAAVSGGDCALH